MIQFFTSSPFLYQHDPATLNPANEFVDRLRCVLPDHPRTLFICSDPKSYGMTRGFARDCADAFARAEMPLGPISVLDGKTAWKAYRMIAPNDFIVIMGGHVPTQNAFFRKIRLRKLMKKFDGVLMTISAGSMNSADTVYAQPEEEGESSPDFPRFLRGLGLTDCNILPHFQQVCEYELDGLRLFEDITFGDSWGHEFFAFPDGTYIYRDDEEYAILGECYRVHDGSMEQLTKEGERIDLTQ